MGLDARPRNRAEARLRPRNEETGDTLSLAFHAEAVSGDAWSLVKEKGAYRFRQLIGVDRAPPEFVINVYVIAYRGGAGKRFYHLRRWIDKSLIILDARPVSERLQASRCGAGTNGDEISRSFADLYDVAPLAFRRYGPLHEGDIEMSPEGPVCGLPEIGDLEQPDEVQEFFLQIQDRELAAVAGGEFENSQQTAVWSETSGEWTAILLEVGYPNLGEDAAIAESGAFSVVEGKPYWVSAPVRRGVFEYVNGIGENSTET